MDSIQIPTVKAVLAIGLLIATTGLAQAYAVPPTPLADLGIASSELGRLLWMPLVLLVITLAAGLAWSLRSGTVVKPIRPIISAEPTPATRPTPIRRKDLVRHRQRRWRSIPAAAH